MNIIEILLPLYDNEGARFGDADFVRVREDLVAHFGGLTAYVRNPAQGVWEEGGGRVNDEIVIFEVVADWIDRSWWRNYRAELEKRFRQDVVMIRAREMEQL